MSRALAIQTIRKSGLPRELWQDLYEQYEEDEERFSPNTALEKLDNGIGEAKDE